MKKQNAFTLAEVLITLGIIGVVAALTLPTLITNYQKKQTTTKLKYFRSLLAQSSAMRNKDTILGTFKGLDELTPLSPDAMLEYYEIYWKPYIKTIKYEKKTKGLITEFANGTGAYFIKHSCPGAKAEGCLYILYCTQYKHCQNINETSVAFQNLLNTKNIFLFWYDGRTPADFRGTREEEIISCKNNYYYCSNVIEKDGWEIREDYPW